MAPNSGIGQQVYEHILGVQQKQVVMRRAEEFLTLRTRGPTNEFDALDAVGPEYALRRWMCAVLPATTSPPQRRTGVSARVRRNRLLRGAVTRGSRRTTVLAP